MLSNAKGQVLVGQPGGAMGHFIMGLLEADDPVALSLDLEQLRADLKADPYFKNVSFQPERGKTAVAFHAKDDLPEVRREVSALLLRHSVKFYAEVRDMRAVLSYVRERNGRNGTYRYHPNELYDSSAARLFKNRRTSTKAAVSAMPCGAVRTAPNHLPTRWCWRVTVLRSNGDKQVATSIEVTARSCLQ